MIGKQTHFGILLVFFALLPTTVYFTYVAFGAEIEKRSESAEEREHEGNSNIQNGFSAVESSNLSNSANNTLTKPAELSLSDMISKGSPIIGNKSAPITIVEFGDFQCQFCGRFAKQTEPLLNSTYIQT